MVSDAPTWQEIGPKVFDLVEGKTVIIHNAKYDRHILHSSAEKWDMPHVDWKTHASFICAMEAYAEFWGDWNDWRGAYRWQKLTAACYQQGIEVANAHNALGDCLMTLALVKKMRGEV